MDLNGQNLRLGKRNVVVKHAGWEKSFLAAVRIDWSFPFSIILNHWSLPEKKDQSCGYKTCFSFPMLVKLQRSKRMKKTHRAPRQLASRSKGFCHFWLCREEWNVMLFGVGCRSTMQAMLIIDGMGQEKRNFYFWCIFQLSLILTQNMQWLA